MRESGIRMVMGCLMATMLMGLLWSPLAVSSKDPVDQAPKIAGPEEALDLALQITGFGPRMPRVPSAEAAASVTETFSVDSDNTPFLADSVNGKKLVRVRLDSVDIRPAEAISKGYDQWERKNFEVEIDLVSGHVVRIRTVSRAPQVPPEASAESATAQLASNGERYWGFVDSLTSFGLLKALNAGWPTIYGGV